MRSVDINTPAGKALFSVTEGIVVNHTTQRWAETHVSSSGGGGVGGPGGYVAAPTVHSTVVQREHTQFWVQEDSGQECPVTLSSDLLPVANGQRVRIVFGGGKTYEGEVVFARNLTSGAEATLHGKRMWEWARRHKIANYPLAYRFAFHYAPLLLMAYFFAVFMPLMVEMINQKIMREPNSIAAFGQIFAAHFGQLHLWSPDLTMRKIFTENTGVVSTLLTFGLTSFVFCKLCRWAGYWLLGRWMQPVLLLPLKKTARELADGPAS